MQAQEHTTLSTIPKLIANVLKIEGCDIEAVFRAAGLDIENTLASNGRIPMNTMYELWEAASVAADKPAFGLLAASLFQPAYLKGIGLAWIASDTLEEGLKRFVKHISMVNTAVKIDILDQGDRVCVQYLPQDVSASSAVKAHSCAVQLGLGFLLRMFRLAAGRAIPVSLVFVKESLTDELSEEYAKFFDCEIIDGAEHNGIAFDKQILNEPLPAADAELASLNDRAVESYLSSLEVPEMSKAVRECLVPLLPTGCPSEEEVAVRLNMSRRTLQRRLRAENTSYGSLLTQLRSDLAKSYLRESNLAITEIAYQLGYSSPSTFARAFKQMYQCSPKEFRAIRVRPQR